MSYGPSVVQYHNYKNALLQHQRKCISYVSNLSPFDRYCVWRYTIGSASVNSQLIFLKQSDNSVRWTYLFFLFYHNTFGNKYLPQFMKKYDKFFVNPKSYNTNAKKEKIAFDVIKHYIGVLQHIILNSPSTTGDFDVFKVAGEYPGLPKKGDHLPVDVLQLPFNSTTVSPYFNFAPFIKPESTCCLFNITIPKGSKCLYIPSEYHAYPFEHEIILPFHCVFKINEIKDGILNFIDPSTVNTIKLADEKDIVMGNVYILDEYFPCGQSECQMRRKRFTVYYASYRTY